MFRFLLFFLFFAISIFAEGAPGYVLAEKELPKAWERIFPLAYGSIVTQDPQKKGILQEKRADKRKVWIYNFLVFMPKYDRNQNQPTARGEGREILVFFLWEPSEPEEPYRIQLGELNQNL